MSDDSGLLFLNALLTATKIEDLFRDPITQLLFLWGTVLNCGVFCNADDLSWASPHILLPVTRSKVGPQKSSVCVLQGLPKRVQGYFAVAM